MRKFRPALWCTLLTLVPGFAGAADIRGDYVEARNADVFTGPCFSNAEVLHLWQAGRHGVESE